MKWTPTAIERCRVGDFTVSIEPAPRLNGYHFVIESGRWSGPMPLNSASVAKTIGLNQLRRMLQEALDALGDEEARDDPEP